MDLVEGGKYDTMEVILWSQSTLYIQLGFEYNDNGIQLLFPKCLPHIASG